MRPTVVILSLLAIMLMVPSLTYAQPTQWPAASGGNDHWYELILNPVSWTEANALAAASSWNGVSGHLATLTSAAENDFVYQLLNDGDAWLGGYQEPINNPVANAGWHWVTGEAWSYTNWSQGEPNDSSGPEFYLQFDGYTPYWNDTSDSSVNFFIVEYESLLLNNNRFKVEVDWLTPDGSSGKGTAVALTDDSGYFWFFENTNVELLVKIHDGCGANGYYWFFYGALTDVEYTVTVTDTQTSEVKEYYGYQHYQTSSNDVHAFACP